MAGRGFVEGLPVPAMDEQHDRPAPVASGGEEQVEPMAVPRTVGTFELAGCDVPVGPGVPVPAGDMRSVLRNPGPVVVFGFEIGRRGHGAAGSIQT
jgi:hypothetical protein